MGNKKNKAPRAFSKSKIVNLLRKRHMNNEK